MKAITKTYQYFQERVFIIRVTLMYAPFSFYFKRIPKLF
jgi:hypothetical protein